MLLRLVQNFSLRLAANRLKRRSTGDCCPTTAMADDRVLVYDLEKQDVRAVHAKDIQNTYCGRLDAHTIGSIPIGKGSRKVDVVLKGSTDTNEVDAHVATVTIPFNVMVQRCMGHFKEILITTDTAPEQTNHHC